VSTSVEHSARTVLSIDPATGEVWQRWTASSREDIAAAVQRARVAQPAWAERPLGDRGRVLERFRRLLFEHRAEMASLIEREAGKPAAEAMMADVSYGDEHARNIDAFARFWHGRTLLERLGGAWRSLRMLVRRERPI
jgi:acyl-CoA reductase-like NAD-dependent aldehyde dehydrogenase